MFRLVAVLMLSASAAVLTAAPQTEPDVTVTEADGLYMVSASFVVAAHPAFAVAALTDYQQIPAFMPEVRVSNVLARTEGGALVEQEAVAKFMVFSKRVHLVLEIQEEPGMIRFRDTFGRDFKRYEGSWTIREEGSQTRVTYTLTAKPSFDVPGGLLKRLLKRDASRTVERLQAEIVARAAK